MRKGLNRKKRTPETWVCLACHWQTTVLQGNLSYVCPNCGPTCPDCGGELTLVEGGENATDQEAEGLDQEQAE